MGRLSCVVLLVMDARDDGLLIALAGLAPAAVPGALRGDWRVVWRVRCEDWPRVRRALALRGYEYRVTRRVA